MKIFVKTFEIRYTLQKMMILGGIPAKEDHKAPGKSLAGDDSRRHGKTLAGAPARPLPRTPIGPLPGPRQPRLHHHPQAAASSTSWAGTSVATGGLYANSASTCVVACRSS